MIYTTLLNPSYDLIYTLPDNSKDTYVDLPARFFPAGKGLNTAKVIAELDEEVSLVSLMPEDDCERFTAYMEQYGINHKPFTVSGSVRVNTTLYTESTKTTQHFNSMGSTYSTQIQDHFEQHLSSLYSEGDTWLFSGSLPGGIEPTFYETLIKSSRESGCESFLDSRGKALEFGIQAHPLVITPNEEELESLFEESIEGVQHLALKGKRLIDSGIETVLITLGEDGVIALQGNECLLCKAPEVDVLDTVGCGDAFLAGVAVGRKRGFSFHEICRMAVACGTSNALHLGPGEIEKDQVWHLMEKVQVLSL